MVELWESLIDGLGQVLGLLHDLVVPVFGAYAWGIAIILLTAVVRILLLPLAIKQINSTRSLQRLQPEIAKIQKKYKTDRSLLRTNPEKYRAQRQKQQEAMMGLYKEHNVNPAASCLPILAQSPVFIALFYLLRDAPQLEDARFVLINSLSQPPSSAGIGAYVLIALMGATTYLTQRQMMVKSPAMMDNPQQKILLYVMPAMLVIFGINFPTGVLLYWVTTNLWTMGQQWFMFRHVEVAGTSTAKTTGGR